jgi:hypothetical protein
MYSLAFFLFIYIYVHIYILEPGRGEMTEWNYAQRECLYVSCVVHNNKELVFACSHVELRA